MLIRHHLLLTLFVFLFLEICLINKSLFCWQMYFKNFLHFNRNLQTPCYFWNLAYLNLLQMLCYLLVFLRNWMCLNCNLVLNELQINHHQFYFIQRCKMTFYFDYLCPRQISRMIVQTMLIHLSYHRSFPLAYYFD